MDKHFFIEKKNDYLDFPFYNGKPKTINTAQWAIILGILFIGFLISSFWDPNTSSSLAFLVIIVFSFMKLFFGVGSLALFAGKDAFLLFRKFKPKDLLFLAGILIVDFLYAGAAVVIVNLFDPAKANPAVVSSTQAHGLELFLINTLSNFPNLLGEEFLALLPFLAFLYFFYQRAHWSRNKSIAMALLLSSIIFGLLHLPTYQWNWLQVIFVIGLGRSIETAAYIRTKSIWASFLVHFMFDTLAFLVGFLA